MIAQGTLTEFKYRTLVAYADLEPGKYVFHGSVRGGRGGHLREYPRCFKIVDIAEGETSGSVEMEYDFSSQRGIRSDYVIHESISKHCGKEVIARFEKNFNGLEHFQNEFNRKTA